jgi:fructose-1-phosphate kinase PfkB-like protein
MENLPDKVLLFQGGTDKQRTHLNKVVEATNDLIDAVKELQDNQADTVVIAFVDSGTLVDFEIQGTRIG